MKYNWSIRDLIIQERKIYKLLFNSSNLTKEQINNLKEDLWCLSQLKKELIFNKDIFTSFAYETYMDKNHFLTKNTYDIFINIPNSIRKNIINATSCYKGFIDNYSDKNSPKIYISDDQLIELSYNFFKWLPTNNTKYEKLFAVYTNPNNHLLRFIKDYDNTRQGYTRYLFDYINKPYFSVSRNFTIDDFCTLNHELAHGMFFRKDPTIYDSIRYFLSELEGDFFDFLSIQFLKKYFNKNIIFNLQHSMFCSKNAEFYEFLVINKMIKQLKRDNQISISSINNFINKKNLLFSVDSEFIFDLQNENPKQIGCNLFSYLIFLDLEQIYLSDPEYAFYLFERIRNNKTNDIYTNLRENGISFMDDGYESLQKTIKMINNLK